MSTMNLRDLIINHTRHWFLSEPLLFAILVIHDIIENEQISTIRIGKQQLQMNPDWAESLSEEELDLALTQELYRALLKHPYERTPENPELAYMASNLTIQEYELTDTLAKYNQGRMGKNTPAGYFEAYYARLEKNTITLPLSSEGSSKPEELYGKKNSYMEENAGLWGEDPIMSNRINGEIQKAQRTNSFGSVPGNLVDELAADIETEVNYREVLKRFKKSIVSSTTYLTRMRPSRRYGYQYMGKRRESSSKIAFYIDVSGSMTDEVIKGAVSVVNSIFKASVAGIDVFQFDTEIKNEEPLSVKKALSKFKVFGRGGTDIRPVFEHMESASAKYDGYVIFTDGYASYPTSTSISKNKVFFLFETEDSFKRNEQRSEQFGYASFVSKYKKKEL